ncbi:MAG TPA: type II toxin-antitoxin system RelE/ParE family toxin [Verrucomicrobiae bacterium]|jgi:toxin ParE1/3/4|nr:type II toxin-antitoxin system RelE/ParE family toxin [Verrucomicrobiae bacterium]
MSFYRFSTQANLDIEAIANYISDLNPLAADHFLSKLDEICELLAKHPGLGRLRPTLGPGLRSFPIGNFLIFYVVKPEEINVVRVLYGGRDLPAAFFGEL